MREHLPGFVDRVEPIGEYGGDDPLAAPWLERWRSLPGFLRFSDSDGRYLMAEMEDGSFWVTSIVQDGQLPPLPAWSKAECDARRDAAKPAD